MIGRVAGTARRLPWKPAALGLAGLGLCAAAAAWLDSLPARPAADRVAYSTDLSPAEDRGAGWVKFAAAGDFDGQGVARALGALDDSRRIVAAFEDMGYKLETLRVGEGEVPRVFLRTLPTDLSDVDSIDLRKSVFIKTLLPPILRVNEEIQGRRDALLTLAAALETGRALDENERAVIGDAAAMYGVKPGEPAAMLRELLRRVDIVPPSLALTQAALESGWGTSRFAQQGNALFGQKAFSATVESLISLHKNPKEVHRMRSYDSLLSAVRSYAHNLNSHMAYSEFRAQRAEQRKKAADRPLDSDSLARTLLRYSERGLSYTADVRQMIRSNAMRQFDGARLETDGTTQLASGGSSGA
ncbi:MAG: glucosaminidase domain-containing protein [Alphaproteobacteria bacterium]